METMIRAFFSQTEVYFSESKEMLRRIDRMHPTYAANAAEKLLREAPRWSRDAGVEARRPTLWLINTPLFQALLERASSVVE